MLRWPVIAALSHEPGSTCNEYFDTICYCEAQGFATVCLFTGCPGWTRCLCVPMYTLATPSLQRRMGQGAKRCHILTCGSLPSGSRVCDVVPGTSVRHAHVLAKSCAPPKPNAACRVACRTLGMWTRTMKRMRQKHRGHGRARSEVEAWGQQLTCAFISSMRI